MYYQIATNYSTSGSTRTYSLNDVSATYSGGTTTSTAGETYSSSCLKADCSLTMTGGTVSLSNSGLMSKSIKVGSSAIPGTVTISGGSLTCHLTSDMYLNGSDPVYCSAIKTDNYYGTGGTITITANTGKASRGISADALVRITDGIYLITNDCAGLQGTSDTYTAKGITCDQDIELLGGTFQIQMTGTGGKCVKADGTLTIGTEGGKGPQLKATTSGASLGSSSSGGMGGFPGGNTSSSNSSSAKAIKAQGTITVNGGALLVSTASNGAEGLESKTSVTINGGLHYFQCYDDCINSPGIINFAGGTPSATPPTTMQWIPTTAAAEPSQSRAEISSLIAAQEAQRKASTATTTPTSPSQAASPSAQAAARAAVAWAAVPASVQPRKATT